MEETHVKNTYSKIANHFDSTRVSIWTGVKEFLDNIPIGSKCLEIGCGNGKNMNYRNNLNFHGIDNCPEFVELCQRKGLNVNLGKATDINYPDCSFDFSISIAVFHHIATNENRILAFNEMVRTLKPNGMGLVYVWALEQPPKSKKRFTLGDNMVSWTDLDGKKYDRYYHIFNQDTFNDYIGSITGIEVVKTWLEFGNWAILFKKI